MVSGAPVTIFQAGSFAHVNRYRRSKLPSTMSKMDDELSIETPLKGYTSKRQKIDPEVQIKLTYPKQEGREDHMLHVLF
jgi:hypothetical protein